MDTTRDATTMAPDKPRNPEQKHEKRHDDDDLLQRDGRLNWHGKAPLVARSPFQRQRPCQKTQHLCCEFLMHCFFVKIYVFKDQRLQTAATVSQFPDSLSGSGAVAVKMPTMGGFSLD
jgi:hypothetical protein